MKQEFYAVEKILSKRIKKGQVEFYIKWENYPKS